MDGIEPLLLIGSWALLGACALLLFSHVFRGREMFSLSLAVFVAGFMARVVAIVCNEEWGLFDQKLAGNLSLALYSDHILHGGGVLKILRHEFGLQVLLNLPIWTLFGESRISLLLSNACVGALAAPLAGVLLCKSFDRSTSIRGLVLLSLYPAGFNFSVFGLRDPIIFLGMLLLVLAAVRVWQDRLVVSNLALFLFGSVIVLLSRPELAYVVMAVCAIPVMNMYLNVLVSSLRSQRALRNAVTLSIPVVLLGAMAVAMTTGVAARNIGAHTLNPAEIASKNAIERFDRHDSTAGGGSHMLSNEMYVNLPWYLRVPVQTAGLIMLPFPWAVTSVSRALAFGDSMFLILLSLYGLANAVHSRPLKQANLGRLTLFLMLIAFVGVLGLGFVVSNFGNGFRMRLAVTPLVFAAASICPAQIRIRFSRSRIESARNIHRATAIPQARSAA